MVDDNIGMFWIMLRIRAYLIITSTGGIPSPSSVTSIMYLRVSVDFKNYEIIGYETKPAMRPDLAEVPKIINGPQFFTKNWTVYRCNSNNNSVNIRNNFIFYRKRKNTSGIFLPMRNIFDAISSDTNYLDYEARINSAAEIGEYLFLGVERASRDGWIKKIIRIDTSDNTWEDVEIKITGIIRDN